MFPTVLAVAGVLTALAFLLGGESPGRSSGSYGPDEEDIGDWPSDPTEAVRALQDEFISQSVPRNREKLAKLLRGKLTKQVDEVTYQVAMPCDLDGAPSFDQVAEMGLAIGEAYRVPVRVDRVSMGRYPFAVLTVGPNPAAVDLSYLDREEMGRHESVSRRGRPEEFGGLVDLIFQSVVASAVGTVTSMGVQDLVHSMGGERRLARIMRHYRNAEARGDEAAMARIREKVTRSASRIKGRRVDWSEVEGLMAQR